MTDHPVCTHLVGHVEEAEELPLLDDGRELLPLLGPRVHPRWVVRARVQQDYAPLRNFLQVVNIILVIALKFSNEGIV